METNEYIIKLVGSACIEKEITNGNDYYILCNASCYSDERKNNDNGSVDIIYKLRLLGEVTISDKGQTLIKGKSKKEASCSERLRNTLYIYHEQYNPAEDFETFYKEKMEEFINSIKAKLEH